MDKYKDVEFVFNEYDPLILDKLPAYIAGGQQVDIFTVQNPLFGMQYVGDWCVEWLMNETDYPRDFKVGVAPLPVDSGTERKTWGAVAGYSVAPTTKYPDVAVEFLIDMNRYGTAHSTLSLGVNAKIEALEVYTGDEKLPGDDITNEELKAALANPDATFLGEKIMGAASSDYSLILLEEAELYLVKEQDLQTTIDNIEKRVNEAILAELAEA